MIQTASASQALKMYFRSTFSHLFIKYSFPELLKTPTSPHLKGIFSFTKTDGSQELPTGTFEFAGAITAVRFGTELTA